MKTFTLGTNTRQCFIDVTQNVSGIVGESGVSEGICVVYAPHTTGGLAINENEDPNVSRDILEFLKDMIPAGFAFRHSEGNSDAHVMATLIGSSVTVPITGGRLALGTWQGIYFVEFDGPRSRRCNVTVIGK
ncbi:YjbQ family protein [bacterium]|nr:MAG: YjbQ family protein [bacterium]